MIPASCRQTLWPAKELELCGRRAGTDRGMELDQSWSLKCPRQCMQRWGWQRISGLIHNVVRFKLNKYALIMCHPA